MLYLNLDIVRMATTELLIHLGEEIVVEEISSQVIGAGVGRVQIFHSWMAAIATMNLRSCPFFSDSPDLHFQLPETETLKHLSTSNFLHGV